MLMAMIRGNNRYMARHLAEMETKVQLSQTVHLTGGGISKAFIQCKNRWMGNYNYILKDNSSVLGAAMLGHYHLTNEALWDQ
jgi:hypothetical protein